MQLEMAVAAHRETRSRLMDGVMATAGRAMATAGRGDGDHNQAMATAIKLWRPLTRSYALFALFGPWVKVAMARGRSLWLADSRYGSRTVAMARGRSRTVAIARGRVAPGRRPYPASSA